MLNRNKKGFTIVELVIVIAVIAVLAAVLIPTFAGIIKKANESAYLQERTNQMMADLAEKITNEDYYTWEDFESKVADELAKLEGKDGLTPEEVKEAIDKAITDYESKLNNGNTGLTEDQIKDIIEKALEGSLTISQVQSIVQAAIGKLDLSDKNLPPEVVQQIINDAIKDLQNNGGEIGISKEEMQEAINNAISSALPTQPDGVNKDEFEKAINDAVNEALNNFTPGLSADQIKDIINNALEQIKPTTPENPGNPDNPDEPGTPEAPAKYEIVLELNQLEMTSNTYNALPSVTLVAEGRETIVDPKCSWTSNNPAIVSIMGNQLAAVSAGTAKITVTCKDPDKNALSASFTVVVTATETPNDPIPPVEDVPVTGIALDKTTAALEIEGLDEKKTVTLTVTFSPDTATNKNVNWSSSKESVATVDANGVVTAVGVGTTTITVTTEDGGYSATCEVTVTKHKHSLINITPVDDTYHKGDCIDCQATVENLLHQFYNGVCACSKQMIYTYSCGSTGVDHFKVKKDAYGRVYYQSPRDQQWYELSKCVKDAHSNKEADHYNCPAEGCQNCLHDVTCEHTNIIRYTPKDGTNHYAHCGTCLEEIPMQHSTLYGTCAYCGNHNCLTKYEYIDDFTHRTYCNYCTKEEVYNHSHKVGEEAYDTSTPGKHKANCMFCTPQEEDHNPGEDGICTVCGINTRHECTGTYTYVAVDGDHHKRLCADPNCPGTLVTHNNGSNVQCPSNNGCGVYIVNNSNYSKFKNTAGNMQKKTVYIKADTITAWDAKIAFSNKGNATIDLCNGTLNLTASIEVGVAGCVLTIQNGTIKTTAATIEAINNYVSQGKIVLNNVTLTPTN